MPASSNRLTLRPLLIAFSVFFLFLYSGHHVVSQEHKPAEQKSAAPKPAEPPPASASTELQRAKNEVELMLEEIQKNGEPIFGVCIENCGDSTQNDGDTENGRALELAKPAYPPLARMAHAAGQVKVQLIIGLEGNVIAASAIDGHPLLFAVSVAAARASRFSPTKYKGKPVKVVGVLQYNFVAQ